MAECEKCGKEIADNARFCPQCGAPAGEGEKPSTEASRETIPAGVMAPPPGAPPPPLTPPVGPSYPREKRRLSRGALIAIVAGGVVLVLVMLMVILFAFVLVNVLSEPADVANAYTKAIKNGDLTSAWNYLSTKTQKEEGRAGFNAKLGPYSKQIETYYTRKINVSGGAAQITMQLTLSSGDTGNWYFLLIKEGGKWKIRTESPKKSDVFE